MALECVNLTKRYGRREVVKGVSITLREGEVVGLLGPNGAGKTTTFYMLVGLERADSGQILIGGVDVGQCRFTLDRHSDWDIFLRNHRFSGG